MAVFQFVWEDSAEFWTKHKKRTELWKRLQQLVFCSVEGFCWMEILRAHSHMHSRQWHCLGRRLAQASCSVLPHSKWCPFFFHLSDPVSLSLRLHLFLTFFSSFWPSFCSLFCFPFLTVLGLSLCVSLIQSFFLPLFQALPHHFLCFVSLIYSISHFLSQILLLLRFLLFPPFISSLLLPVISVINFPIFGSMCLCVSPLSLSAAGLACSTLSVISPIHHSQQSDFQRNGCTGTFISVRLYLRDILWLPACKIKTLPRSDSLSSFLLNLHSDTSSVCQFRATNTAS